LVSCCLFDASQLLKCECYFKQSHLYQLEHSLRCFFHIVYEAVAKESVYSDVHAFLLVIRYMH
jgi:hypothetical protein